MAAAANACKIYFVAIDITMDSITAQYEKYVPPIGVWLL